MRSQSKRSFKRLELEQLETRHLLAADVYISEFVAGNDSTLADEDGDFPDWLEIYNAGPDAVNFDDWHLTDDADRLKKWAFPAQELSPGNFLIVYLSDKDRAVANNPLHANFKLKTSGEYLALTQATGQDTTNIVSEFAPEYPSQFTDISYGFGQSVSVTEISTATDSAKFFVPSSNALGTNWTRLDFSDDNWPVGTASLGYQKTVPGFTVQDAKSNSRLVNLSEAVAVLDGSGQTNQSIAVTPVVNFIDQDGGGGIGRFGGDVDFPNDTSRDDNDFAIRATGTITIPSSGTWSFGINSDDGARLRIDGSNVINDDTLHAPRDTVRRATLTAGEHDVELVFFERGGGAEVELYAARGRHTSFNSNFRLIGDVESGGLKVETAPSGGTTSFGQLYETNVGDEMFGESSSIFVRIPVTVADPSTLDSLTLRMNYDDGYVAYLNGQEVARKNAPLGNLSFDAVATSDRLRLDAEFAESVDISPHIGLLKTGENLLAIHGLNDASDSDEFLIRAELSELTVGKRDLLYFPEPTPRAFNPATGVEGFLTNEIVLSHPRGFYDEAFTLSLDSRANGATIRYTTDGSAPTAQNGLDYSTPLIISGTTTVRARAFKAGLDPSFVETATYIFLDDVLTQSPTGRAPAGFPSDRNINGQTLDYGMDPAIVNSNAWKGQLRDALTQVPTMSVVMDIDDLLGESKGIYTHAQSHGKAWERPTSLELINADGSEGFQVEAGIRIRGGFSRSGNNPKHAFRLFFREQYGDSSLDFPLFGDEGADRFDKIDLRTTQNYSWAFQNSRDNAFVRDVFSRDVQRELGQPYTRSRFYHLYINGQYWGLFQTQERAEARFAETYFGGNKEDYDVVKSAGSSGGYRNEATDGTLDAYRRLADYFYQRNGLSDTNINDYWRAQGMNPDGIRNPDFERLLDVDNLIDYMVITYYTGDRDGPVSRFVNGVNNYFGIFNREDPDGFKFFEHDSEHSLDKGFADLALQITSNGSEFERFNPLWMHEQLASSNTEYRLRFADAVHKHLENDGVLTTNNAKALIDARAAEIDDAIIAESARWGDAKRSNPFTKNDWSSTVSRAKSFLDGRPREVIEQFRGLGWYPAANPPEFQVAGTAQHGGETSPTDDILLLSSSSVDFDQTIVRRGTTWKYLDDGSNQQTAWRSRGFDDSSWSSGRAQLGYGDNDEVTKVDFGSSGSNKHITTYFRRTFNVADPSSLDALKLRLLRDDGAVVYLNGQEIARTNLREGSISYLTTAIRATQSENSFFEFDVNRNLLRPGDNVLAVEIHQVSRTSSDISFDLELVGGQLDAAAAKLFYTVDGTDPRLAGGAVNPSAVRFNRKINLAASATITARSLSGGTWSVASVADFNISSGATAGDFNADAVVNVEDVDLLVASIAAGSGNALFDLDGSGSVDGEDLTFLVESILGTKRGDTDLDGDVDFRDFLKLSANFGMAAAGWAQGNFDLDSEVRFNDFLQLSANFGNQA